jgi:polysaccharide pyruvyl transferase WcaK-like protein
MEAVQKYREMPGDYGTVNAFDLIYSGLTVGLVYGLGGLARVLNAGHKWRPGQKLQVLFLAYSGARNTGAEVRVGECIRQVNQVLGEENIDINMMTLDEKEAAEYFKGYRVNMRQFSSVFFPEVFRQVLANDVIVLVEGSCWKENFATALLLYFLYGAGLARQLGKPCFSYAVDAGRMNKVNNYTSWLLSRDVRLITRSEPSNQVLANIHLPGAFNRVDTAWSMPTETPEWADAKLRELGWDGKQRLAAMSFQNYFYWPVVPNLPAFVKTLATGDATNQYKLVYYHDYGPKDVKEYEAFRDQCAAYMDWIAETYDVQPVVVAMEALDDVACRDLIAHMKRKAILVSCKEYVGVQMGAILRRLSLNTTTRYHSMVLCMPGGVPFIGLSRDERIMGVMKEIGEYDRYYLDYRTPNLLEELKKRAAAILGDKAEAARYAKVIRANLPYYYAQMAMLGLDIRQFIHEQFPDFPLPPIAEDSIESLVPFIPPERLEASRKKFLAIKQAERKTKA